MTAMRPRARGTAAALVAVCLLALPLAACDGGDNGHGGGVGRSAPPPSPSPTPTVSAAAYDASLAAALAPLDASLRAVDKAKEGGPLDSALASAADAATTASDTVGTARTPDDAADGNDRLSQALSDLGDDLTSARSGDARCATSPRVALGSGSSFGSVRAAQSTLTGLGYKVPLTLPKTEPAQHRRLANGHFVRDSGRTGLGRLTVDNDTDSDAVVSLTKGGSTTFMVYVRKHDKTTVRGVRNGSYTVYFTTGSDWNPGKTSFTRDCVFEKFDDKASFHTESVSGGTRYDVLTFSLGLTPLGNASASEVPADAFPS